MVYIRGQAEDYEKWLNAGNKGWGYRDLMKYFIALENNQITKINFMEILAHSGLRHISQY
jgi:choline dehydrogenase-like flavoprotein